MWTIEVSSDASEEEIDQAILEEVDFDYIREQIAKLKRVIENCGPLTEVKERTDDSDTYAFTKTYHEKRGWICDELSTLDPLRVWTHKEDPVNGYSYLLNGYEFTEAEQGIHSIKTWYIAEKGFEKVDDWYSINTEFLIWNETLDGEDDDHFYTLDILDLDMDSDDFSDQKILGTLLGPYYSQTVSFSDNVFQ